MYVRQHSLNTFDCFSEISRLCGTALSKTNFPIRCEVKEQGLKNYAKLKTCLSLLKPCCCHQCHQHKQHCHHQHHHYHQLL